MIHDVIPTKYHRYLSTTIIEHAIVMSKVNKSRYGHLHNMTPHYAYSIIIHVLIVTLGNISREQKK